MVRIFRNFKDFGQPHTLHNAHAITPAKPRKIDGKRRNENLRHGVLLAQKFIRLYFSVLNSLNP